MHKLELNHEQTKKEKLKGDSEGKFTVDLSKFDSANAKLEEYLEKVNTKKFGKKLNRNHILAFAISKLEDSDVRKIQDQNLSASDLLNKMYSEHLEKTDEKISKEEFIIRNLNKKLH